MYRGFNLKIPDDFNKLQFLKTGREILEETNQNVKKTLEEYLLNYGSSLNGNKIIEDWFPEINSHVFLSHSHKDREKAIMIAGILYEKFDITTFIDSTVWGNSNDLLKKIDDKYCLHANNENYDYDKRNYSTAHVHLMLSTALNKMIDKSECLFFLNSPNSISTSLEISQKTNSPWIFSEIATSKIIKKKTPDRKKSETRLFSTESMKSLNENAQIKLNVEYELELSHLKELNTSDFNRWLNVFANSPEEALDQLYSQHRINPKFLK
ncbi:hypothetical protein L1276_002336 [Flavobacterium sp. HSC-32F16]|uniref:hypothetical protein n=1 Tax=Flavobacterium sp. HSC-32F16 TaxID=2910964 RepID=UPI0020A41060|nr:hypothetical protein [Flavobacterium sp. HSC-32F16]MCP2027179.1 hypothetical protein [Flavobacterium sp. HSC-32F16]